MPVVRQVTVGAVLGEAWGLYTRFFVRFALVALAVFATLDLIAVLAQRLAAEGAAESLVAALVGLVVFVLGTFAVQGILVEAVRDVRDGKIDQTIGQLYHSALPRFPALIGAGLLASLGIGIGLIAFVIPGLYLLTRWAVLVPAIVIERRGVQGSFTRSSQLVRGHGWTVFGIALITLVGGMVASGVLGALFSPLPGLFGSWLGSLAAHTVVAPFQALAFTVLYYRLAAERDEPVDAAYDAAAAPDRPPLLGPPGTEAPSRSTDHGG